MSTTTTVNEANGKTGASSRISDVVYQSMVDSAPINIMFADRDMVVRYMNPASLSTLRTLEAHLPVLADQVVGSSLDIFHKDPSYQRGILADQSNMPRHAQIRVGPEILDLLVTAMTDASGKYVGAMATWSVITERLRLEEESRDGQAVSNTIAALSRATTMDDAVQLALDTVREAFGWAYGSYWKVDASDNALHYVAESGDAGEEFRRVTLAASFKEGIGLSGRAWKARDLFFTKDIGQMTDCVRAPVAQKVGVKSGVCFPIIVEGDVVGTMDFFATETLEPSENRLNSLRNVGIQVSQALGRITRAEAEQMAAERMRALLRQIGEHATSLSSASEELSVTATQMSSGAEETSTQAGVVATASEQVASNVESVASGIEEMSASISEIARNTTEAAQVGSEAVQVAEETNTAVTRLGESSVEIGQVVKLITSIAQQTNLLALNATIEAARAGEAGKGFAVVANEVKELAKETAKATEDIGARIDAIQGDTTGAVSAIQRIVVTVGRVNEIQNTIASAVEEQAATTREIGRSVGDASEGAQNITANISGVATAAGTTASGASETQRAAEELSRLASELQKLVTEFNG